MISEKFDDGKKYHYNIVIDNKYGLAKGK